MAEEYTLIDFKASDFKDDFGNTWCTAAFQGIGEPVKWVVKDITKQIVGHKYYGTITEMTSRAGKPYLRFKTEQLPESPEHHDEPKDQNVIQAQWAINAALQIDANASMEQLERIAREFYDMAHRVKAGTVTDLPKTGYDSFKNQGEKLKSQFEDGSPLPKEPIQIPDEWQ